MRKWIKAKEILSLATANRRIPTMLTKHENQHAEYDHVRNMSFFLWLIEFGQNPR